MDIRVTKFTQNNPKRKNNLISERRYQTYNQVTEIADKYKTINEEKIEENYTNEEFYKIQEKLNEECAERNRGYLLFCEKYLD